MMSLVGSRAALVTDQEEFLRAEDEPWGVALVLIHHLPRGSSVGVGLADEHDRFLILVVVNLRDGCVIPPRNGSVTEPGVGRRHAVRGEPGSPRVSFGQ